jgi:hypothetical protein
MLNDVHILDFLWGGGESPYLPTHCERLGVGNKDIFKGDPHIHLFLKKKLHDLMRLELIY